VREAHGTTTSSWIARRERALALAWLALCAAALALMAVAGVASERIERWIEDGQASWVAQLDVAESELASGAPDRAQARLEHVLATNGVNTIKHRLDREHERALELLARAHQAQGRKGRTLATLEQLAEFDPRNWRNHFLQAEALRGFGDGDAAALAYERVLALHPTHWPSFSARVELDYAAGRYGPIPALYERYLDSWLLARVRLEAGEHQAWCEVQADGHTHEALVELELPAGWRGDLRVETRGFSARIDALTLEPALRAGAVERTASVNLPASEQIAVDVSSALVYRGVDCPDGVQRVRIKLTLFKRLEPGLWSKVEKACANTLEFERLARFRERSRVGGCDAGGTYFED
jgi:tetratricopeptide (TPR) repeat protein